MELQPRATPLTTPIRPPYWLEGPYGEVNLKKIFARLDYAVDVGNSRVGYIELKAPGRSIPLTRGWKPKRYEREQWEKLSSLPNVIYTDGISWCRYSFGDAVSPVVTMEGSLSNLREPLRLIDHSFTALIRDFLLWEPEQPRTLNDLIKIVAGLCNLLYDEIYTILTRSPRHVAYEYLNSLAVDWGSLLFPGLDDRKFADAFAQTITFSLLLARSDGISFEKVSAHDIADRLAKKHLVIGRALSALTVDDVVEELRTIETLRRVIGAVKWRWKTPSEDSIDIYAFLYERFLATYDPRRRKDTGSYYTPTEVASSMVRLVDEVLRTSLVLPWGFAADEVIVVDPAMGTGTFLFEVVRSVAQTVADQLGPGAVHDNLSDLVRRRLIGFEIQAAPYAVSELRLHQGLKDEFNVDVPPEELRFLTDALANPREQQQRLGTAYRPIEQARDKANRIKRDIPVMVVIGNPPHVENARGRAPWIEARRRYATHPESVVERPSLDEFRADTPGHGRYESDLHGMPWYFWRWACWKVFEAHPASPAGVVAFVTPSSFLTGRAFSGMREYLRRKCDEGWVIHLSPEGSRPPMATRVFGPDVGRTLCIAVFVRRGNTDTNQPADVRHRAVAGTKAEKLDQLQTIRLKDGEWDSCGSGWSDSFLPRSKSGWDGFPALGDLMPLRSRGVTAGRTWIYGPTPDILRARWAEFMAAEDVSRRAMFPESEEWTIDKKVPPLPGFTTSTKPLSQDHGDCADPIPYSYRSFDRQWIIPDGRLMVRARRPLWKVRSDVQIYISEQDAQQIQGGPGLIFSALIPDLHHFLGWGGGGIRPLWLDDDGRAPNISLGLLHYLGNILDLHLSPDDLIAYIAAVVSHHEFTARFREDLRMPGIRVPLSASRTLWQEAIPIGRELIWLHTFGDRYSDENQNRPRGDLSIIRRQGIRCLSAITQISERLADTMRHDVDSDTLYVSDGAFHSVSARIAQYSVGARRILWHWLNDRDANPRNKESASRLDSVRPDRWEKRFTTELMALLAVLDGCVKLEPRQAELLEEVSDGPLISVEHLRTAGIVSGSRSISRPDSDPHGQQTSLI